MRTYRGVVVVTHNGDVPKDDLIRHLAERTVLEVSESDVDGLQIVILWRTLVDMNAEK